MRVITLDKTKELLGITDTDSDSNITAKIPYIDAKVKQICSNRFNTMIRGDITIDSPYMPVYSVYSYANDLLWDGINNKYRYDSLEEYLEVGQLISGSGIPDNTYIEDIFYNGDIYNDGTNDFDVPVIKLSENATESVDTIRAYVGINICYQDTIAKGIQYLINGTSSAVPENGVVSKGFGPLSKTYSQTDSKIDNKYGMPAWFVKSLPKYQSGH